MVMMILYSINDKVFEKRFCLFFFFNFVVEIDWMIVLDVVMIFEVFVEVLELLNLK